MEKEFNPSNVPLTNNLEADVESLATEFRRVLDTLAQRKTVLYHLGLRSHGLTKNWQ